MRDRKGLRFAPIAVSMLCLMAPAAAQSPRAQAPQPRGRVEAETGVGTIASAQAKAENTRAAPRRRIALSGQQRLRYERLDGQFRPLGDETDQGLAIRTNVSLSAEWPRWRVGGEIMDSREELNDAGSLLNATLIDTLEPIQAFVSRTWGGDRQRYRSTLTAGRMTLDLGSRRLVARNRFRNTVNTFTGLDWILRGSSGRTIHAFYVRPLVRLPSGRPALLENDQHLDRVGNHTDFWGLLYEPAALAGNHRLELYALGLDADEPLDRRDLTTLGARVRRPASSGAWHYEIEAAVQSGRSSASVGGVARTGLDHSAHFVHADIGYTFAGAWKPEFTLLYDLATGDDDPDDDRDGRFDTLYSARVFDYGPTGIYGPFARGNLETPGVRLAFAPARRWTGMAEYRVFRLETARDAWTTTGLRDATGAAGRNLGRQLDARFTWDAIRGRLGIETGFAYFSKGRFVERTAPYRANPSTYFYTGVTTTF